MELMALDVIVPTVDGLSVEDYLLSLAKTAEVVVALPTDRHLSFPI
jgi:hypothetical protein